MADLSQIASSTRDSIGRYFSLVSALPSAVLVAWTVLLVGSGAWTGTPDIAAALRAFTEIGIGGAAGLVLASIAVGVVLHPMQFAFVQFLEGYWGASPVARQARFLRIAAHWRRVHGLRAEATSIGIRIDDLKARQSAATGVEYQQLMAEIAELRSAQRELVRLTSTYPDTLDAFMPTRLGNVLRHYEWTVGEGYGIAAIYAVPYLARVSGSGDMEYVNDQRSQLDLSVRMTVVSFLASAFAVLFLARHGLWLLIVLVPYAASYLSYRGAVVAAAEYGRALGVLVTLNRFALYQRLELNRPQDTAAERLQNADLTHFLRHGDTTGLSLSYRPQAEPPAGGTTA